MKLINAAALAVTVAACEPSPQFQAFSAVAGRPPSAWSPDEMRAVPTAGLCDFSRRGAYATSAAPAVRTAYTRDDLIGLEAEMRRRGLRARDIEILRLRNRSYGTGQSFDGLVCSIGYTPKVNEAFYSGIGHRWQAILEGGDYVYLEGDGTPSRMLVTGWN